MTQKLLLFLLFWPGIFFQKLMVDLGVGWYAQKRLWDGCMAGRSVIFVSMFFRLSALEQDNSLGSTAHDLPEIRRTVGGLGIIHKCSQWSLKPEWREQKSPMPSISMLLEPSARWEAHQWWVDCISMFTLLCVTEFTFVTTESATFLKFCIV